MSILLRNTPISSLNKIGRPDIYVKLECCQYAGSFKSRGVVEVIRKRSNHVGLIAYSTGNHGIATAKIAKHMGIKARILCPPSLENFKKIIMEKEGATLDIVDEYDFNDGYQKAQDLAQNLGYTFIPLFGDDSLLLGYSKIADEVAHRIAGVFTLFAPIGTGSCFLSNARRIKEINSLNKAVAVEPLLYQRISGVAVEIESNNSQASCLSIPVIPSVNRCLFEYIDGVSLISDLEMVQAQETIYRLFGIVSELGSAITLAAALKTKKNGIKKVALITGGNVCLNQSGCYSE